MWEFVCDVIMDNQGEQEEQHLVTYSSENGVKKGDESQCRICLSEYQNDNNPFISPCACIGSVQHIHLGCLKQWLQSKMVLKQNEFVTEYQWKNLECELCKVPIKPFIRHNGKDYTMFQASNPTGPYILLDKLQKESKNSFSSLSIQFQTLPTDPTKKAVHKNNLKVGRGGDSDVRINDISVSREHAQIHLKGKRFFLKDTDSKFGTLVLVRNPIVFSEMWNNVSIQINSTVLSLSLKKNSNSLFSCNTLQPDHDDYKIKHPQAVYQPFNQNQGIYQNNQNYQPDQRYNRMDIPQPLKQPSYQH